MLRGRVLGGGIAALLLAPAFVIVAAGFVAPLIRLAALSVSAPEGPLAAYRELATVDVYRTVLRNTVILALVVSAASLVIGFVLALALTRLEAGWRATIFACVVLPLWVSVLVRTFSWMLILEKNGPLNRFLLALGIIDQPLPLLFAFPGVVIGMVHVLLPYAVLPIYAALTRIDPALLRASDGLGASRATTFRRVLLPLSARGLATAATFTFLLSLGFFVTPALLGGPSDTTIPMLIDSFVNERLDWPLAAAASMTLLAMALAVIGLAGRFVPVGALAEVG
ncbi:putative spermidine/putrescine transport system permease protein [Rhizobiales bacterium GAS113]|nr:putative spermidine/putrescine transport system permease protein [Rhizobiales bacterium GAS113]SED28134.1 putative spermidine/putrescine transport system permease protein [Rhizobiales bacterium GAS188]